MKLKTLMLFAILFYAFTGSSQTNYYYYNGQAKTITYSNRILFVHFAQNLTIIEKRAIISSASLDLIGDSTNIPDYVKLQSRVYTGGHWVYPCEIGPMKVFKDTIKANKPAPCEGCPDCSPYWESFVYNNIESAITTLGNNSYLISVSKGISTPTMTTVVGTDENFYIKIKPGNTIIDFNYYLNAYNLVPTDVTTDFGNNIFKITANRLNSKNVISYANVFFNSGMCDFSTPNFVEIEKISDTNDPEWANQWNLLNTGQYTGIQGADIRIQNAWQFSKGLNQKVAVLDDGAYLNAQDLQNQFLPGFNAVPNSTFFEGTHGTDVSGIIAAIADNNFDIAGVAPESKIVPVKIFLATDDAANIGLADQIAKGINWAWENGASILNCSWGLDYESDLIDLAITNAAVYGRGGKGCVIIFSSGNVNNIKPRYPSSTHPNVLPVGAMTQCNSRKTPTSCDPLTGNGHPEVIDWGSNYGSYLSLVAPGVKIPTVTYNPLTLNFLSGTSASAPLVSGVAALLLDINPILTASEVRRILEFSSNKVGNYCYNWTASHPNGSWNNEMGYGRLNAYNAVQLARPGVTISNPVYNVASQNNTIVTGNIGIIFNGLACPTSLPYGVQFVRRHEVSKNITFQYTDNPVIICTSNGFNLANPNDGRRFAEAINVTNTSATLRTYIYYGYNSIGQELGWIPTSPSNINFSYSVVGSPTPIVFQNNRSNSINIVDTITKFPLNLELETDLKSVDIPYDFNKIIISPNPVQNVLNININLENEKSYEFEIFNVLGVRVNKFGSKQLRKGSNAITFDVSKLKKGIYILKYNSLCTKFIKN